MPRKTMCHHGVLFADPKSVHSVLKAAHGTCTCPDCHRATCREAKTWWKNQPVESAPTLIPGTNIHLVPDKDGKTVRYDAGPAGIEAPHRFFTQCLACGVKYGDATLAGMLARKTDHYVVSCLRKDRRLGFKDSGVPSPWTIPRASGLPTVKDWTIRPLPNDVDAEGRYAEILHDQCQYGYNAKGLRATVGQKIADHMRDRHPK